MPLMADKVHEIVVTTFKPEVTQDGQIALMTRLTAIVSGMDGFVDRRILYSEEDNLLSGFWSRAMGVSPALSRPSTVALSGS